MSDAFEHPSSESSTIGVNPYKGIFALDTADREKLFGRSDHIEQLYQRLQQMYESEDATRFLPVYGASGVGKTSLIKAGLLPALAERPLQASAKVVILRPGRHPLKALASSVYKTTGRKNSTQALQAIEKRLHQVDQIGTHIGLSQTISTRLREIGSSLIIVVDQWEELYTLCSKPAERTAFIHNLLHAARDGSKQVSVIVTMRVDCFYSVKSHPELDFLFATQGFLVPALDKSALREMIGRPMELLGYPLEKEAVEELTCQIEGHKDVLPLLQFALWRLWIDIDRKIHPDVISPLPREGIENTLTVKVGKIHRNLSYTLASEARKVYENLSIEQQLIARHIFCQLVELKEQEPIACDRVAIESLACDEYALSEIRKVLQEFSAPSIQFITHTLENETETVEVTHEVVLKRWDLLRQWLEAAHRDFTLQQRLNRASEEWQKSGQIEYGSWKLSDLELLRQYHQRCSSRVSSLQRTFFAKLVKAQREEKSKQERKRRLSKILLGVCIGLPIFSFFQMPISARLRIKSLSAESEVMRLQGRSADATIYAIVAAKLSQSPLIRFFNSPLFFYRDGYYIAFYETIDSSISADSDYIATSSLRNAMYVNTERFLINTDVTIPKGSSSSSVTSVSFSPDGKRVASARRSGEVGIWDTTTGELIQSFREHRATWLNSIAFSPDGKTIAGVDEQGLMMMNLEEGTSRWVNYSNNDWQTSVAFSPNGMFLANAGYEGVQLRNPKTGELIDRPLKGVNGGVGAITFSPDSKTLAGGHGSVLRLWDIETQEPIGQRMTGHSSFIMSVAFSPDGKILASASDDGTVRRWNVATGEAIGEPIVGERMEGYEGRTRSVAFSPNGKVLASGGNNDIPRLWDAKTGEAIGELGVYSSDFGANTVLSVAFSPDGTRLASASSGKYIQIWDISLITDPPELELLSAEELLKAACNQLQHNSRLLDPYGPIAHKAKRTCASYNRGKDE